MGACNAPGGTHLDMEACSGKTALDTSAKKVATASQVTPKKGSLGQSGVGNVTGGVDEGM